MQPMSHARVRLHLAIACALATAACQAVPPAGTPAFQLDRLGGSLVVTVAPEAAAYRALYLPVTDWDWVEGELVGPGGRAVTVRADAVIDTQTQRRSAVLSFSDVAQGENYKLTVTLYRQGTGETPEVVSRESQEALAIAEGVNRVSFSRLGRRESAATGAAPAVLSGFVASLPTAGMAARLDNPTDVVTDGHGAVYVADAANGTIRRYREDGQGRGWVTALAGIGYPGYANGPGYQARFNWPWGLAMGPDGALYVADSGNNLVRKVAIDASGAGTATTISGVNGAGEANAGAAASFSAPSCIAVAPNGVIFVGEKTRVRKLTPGANGAYTVTTYAGSTTAGYEDGNGATAKFDNLRDLALDGAGNLYAADAGANNRVRRIAPYGTGSSVSTLAMPAGVSVDAPGSLAFDAQGRLMVGDAARLYRFTFDTDGLPVLEVLAGTSAGFADGEGSAAAFNGLNGLAPAPDGFWACDTKNHRLRKLTVSDTGRWTATTRVGDGINGNMNGAADPVAPLGRPTGVAVGADGTIYLADPIKNEVFAIDAGGRAVRVVAGTGASGNVDGAAEQARFDAPAGVAVTADGSLLVTDTGNGTLRRVRFGTDGHATVETLLKGLSFPGGVLAAPDGTVYLTESGNPTLAILGSHRVRKVVLNEGAAPTVTTLAGGSYGFADGPGASARFYRPTGLALGADGTLYVADAENHRIRTITTDAAGQVTVGTFAGTGVKGPGGKTIATAQFDRPTSLVIDDRGRLIVTDYWNARLQVLNPADGTVSTLAGSLGDGYSDGPAAQARFSRPVAIARDAAGCLYVADAHPWGVRKVTP